MPPSAPAPTIRYRRIPYWLTAALVVATFALIALGGLVTSLDAGMAVPDGFWTFGHWSLTAPLESWWDKGPEVRVEHTHRLKGYVVGGLTIAVLISVWFTQRRRRWVRGLAVGLLLFVVAQGVMGILRVDQISASLAMLHGISGQVFLCLTVLMAAALGKRWIRADQTHAPLSKIGRRMTWMSVGLIVVYFIQLILGAAVRHNNAALAIPDFPLHYGSLLPPFSQAGLDARIGGPTHIELWQVWLQFAHRAWAYLLVFKTAVTIRKVFKKMDWPDPVAAPAITLVALLLIQIVLGASTVLMDAPAELATAHQSLGAALLATSVWFTLRVYLAGRAPEVAAPEVAAPEVAPARPTPQG